MLTFHKSVADMPISKLPCGLARRVQGITLAITCAESRAYIVPCAISVRQFSRRRPTFFAVRTERAFTITGASPPIADSGDVTLCPFYASTGLFGVAKIALMGRPLILAARLRIPIAAQFSVASFSGGA